MLFLEHTWTTWNTTYFQGVVIKSSGWLLLKSCKAYEKNPYERAMIVRETPTKLLNGNVRLSSSLLFSQFVQVIFPAKQPVNPSFTNCQPWGFFNLFEIGQIYKKLLNFGSGQVFFGAGLNKIGKTWQMGLVKR